MSLKTVPVWHVRWSGIPGIASLETEQIAQKEEGMELTSKLMPKPGIKPDPCQKQACEIQKCLQANKYIEASCTSVIDAMKKCCQRHTDKESVCCSGFRKTQGVTNTTCPGS